MCLVLSVGHAALRVYTVVHFGIVWYPLADFRTAVDLSPLAGRAVKDASLFDGMRGNNFTRIVSACRMVWYTLIQFRYCRAFFDIGREFAVLFTASLPRRFCALTERLCLSSSPQAFRERLDPKLPSLAYLPTYVVALPTIMNYEL